MDDQDHHRHSALNSGGGAREARRWLLGGRVQGVGYRGFVFNLAQRFALSGSVQNLTGQVLVEAQGAPSALDAFAAALISEAPPLARPLVLSCERIPIGACTGFEILASAARSQADVHVPPDSFLCDDCRGEMLAPQDRRYHYPFINCTQCGPRYTLITRMPYDRANTTMARFELCPACRAEYEEPRDRRFHAQPLACPECGPQLSFVGGGERLARDAALQASLAALRRGEVVAVKGIGGYHLLCDAQNPDAIGRLRSRKQRPAKPLAVMFPWQGEDGLQALRAELRLDDVAASALTAPARPIVLAPRRPESSLPELLAPGLAEVGAMLPYSPLHHLLLDRFAGPLVATSGNISGEPVLTENAEAQERLVAVADAFLHHDRPIARPADDSVVRIIAGEARLLRAGRGTGPIELDLPFVLREPLLAVGGHMKNTIALAWGNRAVLSPHIGDLNAPRSLQVFEQVSTDLQQLYGVNARAIACDAHADYASSRWAARQSLPVARVLHHHAHASALAFEGGLDKTWLTFTWDGVGLGADGTLWGGEALLGRPGAWRRVASFKAFRLPGGERASREPWRSAAALCWESGVDWVADTRDAPLLRSAWQRGLNAPYTTAVGRLFDAASSLLGLCDIASFEGEAAMLLEAAARGSAAPVALPLTQHEQDVWVADWTPLLHALRRPDVPVAQRAMQFHQSLALCIAMIAQRVREQTAFDAVGLTGGVFQNKLLTELAIERLGAAGFDTWLPRHVPCNDGGLAFGQLIEAAQHNGRLKH